MIDRNDTPRLATHSFGGDVCLNLWAYANPDTDTVLRIAGKAYVIPGDRDHQSTILKSLAVTDYLIAHWEPVPEQVLLISEDGASEGATTTQGVKDHFPEVFGPLIERLHDFPTQLCSVAGQYREFVPAADQNCRYLLTYVFEEEDGRLVPQVPAGQH
ncbi:MAG: hypothetical protein QM658_10665 [Gordonia sp. (in: high G+C Gram-positive bacteria)]